MSEEILYIDDGELVYYINENEFITCDEIPRPMLEGIKHLQQKVKQLEKELQITANKCKQLENIRKEVTEYINNHQLVFRLSSKKQIENWFDEFYKDLLNILNKGSESNV